MKNTSSVIFVAFLTSLVTTIGVVYLIEHYGVLRPKAAVVAETVVPDFKGLLEPDARANANASHLALLVASREASAEAKAGAVIRQSLPAGQRVAHSTSISVVLAEEVPKVPAVTNLSVAEATQRLEQRGYTIQVGPTIPSETVASGSIVSQSPKAEEPHAKGGAVSVQVSSGPGDVQLPKLVGIGVNQAKADLEKLGLKPVMRWVDMAETPTYVVLNQKPAAGEKVKPGTEVQLTACR